MKHKKVNKKLNSTNAMTMSSGSQSSHVLNDENSSINVSVKQKILSDDPLYLNGGKRSNYANSSANSYESCEHDDSVDDSSHSANESENDDEEEEDDVDGGNSHQDENDFDENANIYDKKSNRNDELGKNDNCFIDGKFHDNFMLYANSNEFHQQLLQFQHYTNQMKLMRQFCSNVHRYNVNDALNCINDGHDEDKRRFAGDDDSLNSNKLNKPTNIM